MEKLAFVGLGNMGLPMARNLLKAGYDVYGLNRSKQKERAFAESGGKTGQTLAELAADVDAVMTCLPMPEDVEQVYMGEGGMIRNGKPGLVLIDFSTVSPSLSRALHQAAADRGMHFLDAPVSGGTVGAEEATLTIMVGGEARVFDQVRPVLAALGTSLHYVGKAGSGSVVKLLNQLHVGIHTQAVAESFRLGEREGIEPSVLYDILSASFAQSRIMDRHYRQYISRDSYMAGFALKLLHKDMALANRMAEERQSALPAGREVLSLLRKVVETPYADLDMSALFPFQQQEAHESEGRYFAVLLPMADEAKSVKFRPDHLAYLDKMRREGRIWANGKFKDGAGGLILYRANSYEEVVAIVEQDPYVLNKARTFEIHEWDLVL